MDLNRIRTSLDWNERIFLPLGIHSAITFFHEVSVTLDVLGVYLKRILHTVILELFKFRMHCISKRFRSADQGTWLNATEKHCNDTRLSGN